VGKSLFNLPWLIGASFWSYLQKRAPAYFYVM